MLTGSQSRAQCQMSGLDEAVPCNFPESPSDSCVFSHKASFEPGFAEKPQTRYAQIWSERFLTVNSPQPTTMR
jgi:hypothetical protein